MTKRAQVVMCPPSHFDVTYNINPWMTSAEPVQRRRCIAQWQNLLAEVQVDCEVAIVPSQPDLPDMCFVANAGFVFEKIFVPSRFRNVERRGEEKWFRMWFAEKGFEVRDLPENIIFEGAGDALYDSTRQTIWMGYGQRSELSAAEHLQQATQCRVSALRLIDPRFYHLDTCFAPLSNGYALYFPDAFCARSRYALWQQIGVDRLIPVSESDALQFACNAVDLGDRLLLNGASDSLKTALDDAGLAVARVPLSEFIKAGGGAKCLTLPLTSVRNGGGRISARHRDRPSIRAASA